MYKEGVPPKVCDNSLSVMIETGDTPKRLVCIP